MSNILEVKNLKISFRTNSGTVKAVRDISFDLKRGETLAIVGESGSGKSVTSKAILGILAGNSIIEGGEILYDGRDLLHTPEEDMCDIRGDKISMIFQDPLSSLDPIVKIGRQITEAMLLKNKTARKNARSEFNGMLARIKQHMIECGTVGTAEEITELATVFDKFNIEAIKLEKNYNYAKTKAQEIIADIDDILFTVERKGKINVNDRLHSLEKNLAYVKDTFLTAGIDDDIAQHRVALRTSSANNEVTAQGKAKLEETRALMNEILGRPAPNFFRIGYYKYKNPTADLAAIPVEELNERALEVLNAEFMHSFIEKASIAIKHAADAALEHKKHALSIIPDVIATLRDETKSQKEIKAKCAELSAAVASAIDKTEVAKDSVYYTFAGSIGASVDEYFYYKVKNPKEEARYARQEAKRQALIARGKQVDWKVIPKVVRDLSEIRANSVYIVERLAARLKRDVEAHATINFTERAIAVVDYLKEKASLFVNKLTKRIAKENAIKIMDEVGIPESRIRYNQYPFEFSGGMRQRIVIAIALTANPDILICDEPTTALDVTIQAQILELINKLKKDRNLSVIFITHDLGVVANMADRIAVMYAGKIVECGTADDVFYDPRHPYTWALLSSMPDLDTNEKLEAIPGTPPNMIYPPEGDAFAARNKYALKIDFEKQPPMFEISETHKAATWLLHPDAPKVEMPKIISERIARMTARGGDANEQ